MDQYGLIGYPLSHSFSPTYFNQKFKELGLDAHYAAYPLENINQFCDLIQNTTFKGINVTIPYKESIMPFLDDIDSVAQAIGAVNTIDIKNGKTKGYNTDASGFEKSLSSWLPKDEPLKALVLGNGGAAKAVHYVLEKLNINYQIVSRDPNRGLVYEDVNKEILADHKIIINTTPLGMYPNVDQSPHLPYYLLNEKYFLYDLIYNPEKTLFLTEGFNRNSKIKNGYDMLIHQAEDAWKIWNQKQ